MLSYTASNQVIGDSIRRFKARLKPCPLSETSSGGSWLCSAGALAQNRHLPASVLDLGTLSTEQTVLPGGALAYLLITMEDGC